MFNYSALGTSVKRPEKPEDHLALRQIMSSRWEQIRDFPKRPAEEMEKWQLARVAELVDNAYENVPLYREKYGKAGFRPGEIRSWTDFEALPILHKTELIEGFPEKTVSSRHGMEFTTRSSGSSGQFVTLVVSPEAVYEDTVQGARQFFTQSGGEYGPSDKVLHIYTCPWWVSSIDGQYETEFLPTTTPIPEAIGEIRRIRPKILSLYPTYLKALAEEDADLKGAGVSLVVIHSEQSSAKERKALSEQFGIPVRDEFSSEELTRIALECPEGKYHLEEDACRIEIMDPGEMARKMPDGEMGVVIGTNLLNEATPIIRYFQGDYASLTGNTGCGCKSNFRELSAPAGRRMDSIITPSGLAVPAGAFMDLAYNWYLDSGVPVHGLKYRIVQDAGGDVCVNIVPGKYAFDERMQATVRESMYSLLPREMNVSVNVTDALPEIRGTKNRPVVSNYRK